jgi:hypothetical protein
VGEHRFLVQQLPQIPIRLERARADAAQQPRLDLAGDAEHERRDHQHQRHLHGLEQQIEDEVDHRHAATTSRSTISAAKVSVR